MNNLQAGDTMVSLNNEFRILMGEIDKQNVSYVEESLHKDYHDSFVFRGSPGVISSSKTDYVNYLAQGKIGGIPRNIEISTSEEMDQFGIVKAKLESSVMKFDGLFTMILDNSKWKLIKAIIVAEKK